MSSQKSMRSNNSKTKKKVTMAEIDHQSWREIKPIDKEEEDDDVPIMVRFNKMPVKDEYKNIFKTNKNLDMHEVDNPPMKLTTATMITEQLFIGDEETSYDSNFMKMNYITHVLNLEGNKIGNVFDSSTHRENLVA